MSETLENSTATSPCEFVALSSQRPALAFTDAPVASSAAGRDRGITVRIHPDAISAICPLSEDVRGRPTETIDGKHTVFCVHPSANTVILHEGGITFVSAKIADVLKDPEAYKHQGLADLIIAAEFDGKVHTGISFTKSDLQKYIDAQVNGTAFDVPEPAPKAMVNPIKVVEPGAVRTGTTVPTRAAETSIPEPRSTALIAATPKGHASYDNKPAIELAWRPAATSNSIVRGFAVAGAATAMWLGASAYFAPTKVTPTQTQLVAQDRTREQLVAQVVAGAEGEAKYGMQFLLADGQTTYYNLQELQKYQDEIVSAIRKGTIISGGAVGEPSPKDRPLQGARASGTGKTPAGPKG